MKTVVSFAIIICLVVLALAGCQKESEQDKIRKLIATVQKAAEEKDIKKIRSIISENYKDPQGNNYGSVNNLLLAYFFRHQKISIYMTSLNISVKGESARAGFQAVLTAQSSSGSAPSVLPESLGVYAFDVSFRKESGDWKVVSAAWERVGDAAR